MNYDPQVIACLRKKLDGSGVTYHLLIDNDTPFTAAQGVEKGIGSLAAMAPTFILKTEKGYLAAIISGNTRLSYKKIKKELQLKNVCLASADEVLVVTGAKIGQVSLINPEIQTILDRKVMEQNTIFGGCGTGCHTLAINPHDLLTVLQPRVFDFTDESLL